MTSNDLPPDEEIVRQNCPEKERDARFQAPYEGVPYSLRENPRWARCAFATGQELRGQAWRYVLWNGRCWQEFCALHGVKDTNQLLLKLKNAHAEFDNWQHAQVVAGKWKELP